MATLRLATYNVLSGRRPGAALADPVDPAALARSVAALDADLVALQEIDAFQERSGGRDQVADLLAALSGDGVAWSARMLATLAGTPGLTRTWTPASGPAGVPGAPDASAEPGRPAYGIALVTRLPVTSWHEHRMTASWGRLPMMLPRPRGGVAPLLVPDEPRGALAAVVETGSGPLVVAGTHLSFLPPRGALQVWAVTRWLDRLAADRPAVLLGDLNLPGPVPARLAGWQRLAAKPTFPRHDPRIQLDHALGRRLDRWRVTDVRTVEGEVSDHLALVVDLTT